MAKGISPKRKITFKLEAANASTVELMGCFTAWESKPLALKKSKAGTWSKQVSLAAGRYEYRFRVDGQWQDDPSCADRVDNGFGTQNCVCVVQAAEQAPPVTT